MKTKVTLNLWNIITCIFLTIVFLGFLSGDSEQNVYVLVGIYLIIYLIYAMITRSNIQCDKFVFVVSCIMLAVWIYGIILGIFNGNKRELIIRNFAGMTMYLLVLPLSNEKLKMESVIKIIKIVAHYSLYISIITYLLLTYTKSHFIFQIPIINAFIGGGGKGGFVQYFNRELIHVCFAYNAYILFYEKRGKLFGFINLLMASYYYLIVNDSEGDLLAAVLLLIVIIIPMFFKIKKRYRIVLYCIIMCLVIVSILTHNNKLVSIFSQQDIGNARRYEELNYFKSNLTLFGHGLGKELGSIGASGIYNYGTELIYINLFHKFGIFAILILISYVATLYKVIKYYLKSNDIGPDKVIPMSLVAYLVPSLANPMLFSVLSVVSHILAGRLVSDGKLVKIKIKKG